MRPIPITILAGSDHAPGPLPKNSPELHSLSSIYKGAEIKVNDRSLIELLVDSISASGSFSPITIAGPADIYQPLNLNAELLDTNGSISTNLKAAVENHLERFEDQPMALLAYDIILTPEELDQLRQHYEEDSPCCVWVPFVEMPENKDDLGAFGYKPSYGLLPDKDSEAVQVLPGHLGIFLPKTMRLAWLYKLLELTYVTRNHSVATRRRVMTRSVVGSLLLEDLKSLCLFELPRLMASVITGGLSIASELKKKRLTIPHLEKSIGRIFLDPATRLKGPNQGIRHPIVQTLGLAKDVDTAEEAADLE